MKHGHGKYMWTDGDVYEGNYLRDKRDDEMGKLTLVDGTCFEGRFRRNHMIVPK